MIHYIKILILLGLVFLISLTGIQSANAFGPEILNDTLLIPATRIPTWDPGVPDGIPNVPTKVNILDFGAKGDGQTDDTVALRAAIQACPTPGAVHLPAGSYVIKGRIDVPSGIVLRGDGIEKTHILATPGVGTLHTFAVYGSRGHPVQLTGTASKGTNQVVVVDTGSFSVGQTTEIEMDNEDFMTEMAPRVTRGQIVKIIAISGNTLTFDVPLRLEYPLNNKPRVYPVYPVQNVGFEDFHVKHVTSDGDQSSIFYFRHVINSWIKNIESEYAARYHIDLYRSRHITIRDNVIHHSYNYGGDGHGYGVVTTGGHTSDCLITNNTFYMLRHSLLPNYSSNGNVWSYNFSADDNSQQDQIGLPDLATHGNYTHMELFEGNVSQWLHVGDYWGQSPNNTLFRNRVLKAPYSKPTNVYRAGIEVNSTGYPSHGQNIIGNTSFGHIQNSDGYHSSSDYAENLWIEKNLVCQDGITGGNLDQSTIIDNILNCNQAAPWKLPNSLYLSEKPDFWPDNLPWPAIGADIDSQRIAAGLPLYKIPAQIRYEKIMGLSPLPTDSTPTPNPDEIIIDNSDPGFSTSYVQDAWQEYTKVGGQHYGDSHYYNSTIGTSQDTATWSFTVPKPGNYDVYTWWWEGSWRPPDVPYTINHFDGTSTVRVDQRVNGGQWNLLGSYYFESEGSVIVSDDVSSGRDIVADAIRLVYRSENPPPETTPTPTPEPSATPTTEPNAISLILNSPSSIVPGDTVNMDVIARNIPNPGLYGVQFEINYDPNLVSVSNVQVNPNLTFVVENNVDNTIGKIKFAASQQGKVPGLIGDVVLLSFSATAANSSGQITFSFQDEKISDDQAQSLMVISHQYSISIENNGATPDPTTQPTLEPTPTNTVMPPPTTTPEATVFPTPEPTDEPTSMIISGQIILTGRNNDNWSDAIISIANGGITSFTNVNGTFRMTDVPAELLGNITAEAPGYLSAVCNEITMVITSSIALNPIILLSGDINNDNLVDIVDATVVGTEFGQTGINSPADITRNNVIDIFDIVLVSVNFGEIGPTEWNCVTN